MIRIAMLEARYLEMPVALRRLWLQRQPPLELPPPGSILLKDHGSEDDRPAW